ncbi:MAG: tRNA glutamyl-Q(34) synthetase GluQRS [Deltaproteobacteria bacterium HGW-Deltaproteobacteria-18]|jgi:glutamyl-tRNA synthetase|nr:MAG: tRNA glutamyl-Q(34) synthetase GluQRS [Deltaproteobacteria bacterium HGW-Deltaproteobacteria-18]
MKSFILDPETSVRGRLAPSPTGHLHLGNAWSFLLCWLAVRSAGGRMVLRMEDIDPERSRSHFAEEIMRDLAWLGLDWDEGPDLGGPYAPYTQQERLERYAEVIEALTRLGHTYPCYCTRKELKTMASAPHLEDAGPVYPGTCLQLGAAERMEREAQGRRPSLRLHGGGETRFEDLLHGEIRLGWAECGGDFPLRRSDGVIAYQLAVALDDMDQAINLVVRGADILPCTPRQIYLFKLLHAPAPRYAHVPLLLDHEGVRLAKRHQSLEMRALRDKGVSSKAVAGFLGHLAGLLPERIAATPAEMVSEFAWDKIPGRPVVLENDIESVLNLIS